MNVYFLLCGCVFLIVLYPKNDRKTFYNKALISLLLLFLYGAVRLNYGLDYSSYEDFYNSYHSYVNFHDSHMEIGYVLLNKIMPSFRMLLIAQTFFICTTYYTVIRRYVYPSHLFLFFLLFFLFGDQTIFFTFNAIRNGVAVMLFLLFINFLVTKNYKAMIFITLIGASLHTSFLFTSLLSYLVVRTKQVSKLEICIFSAIALILLLFSSSFVGVLHRLISVYFSRYLVYAESISNFDSLSLIGAVFCFSILGIALYVMRKNVLSASENVILRLYILYLFSLLLSSMNFRFSQYFIIPFILGVLIIVNKLQKLSLRAIFLFAVLAYGIYAFFYVWMQSPYFSYNTYYSILE